MIYFFRLRIIRNALSCAILLALLYCFTEWSERKRNDLTTTNPIYRCEELEHRVSIYDTIMEKNVSTADKQEKFHSYLEILSDETDECCRDTKPQLPKPRPGTQSGDPDHDYERLKDKKPENVYLHLLNDESRRCDQLTKPEDQVQDHKAQDQDTKLRDQGQITRDRDPNTKMPDQDRDQPAQMYPQKHISDQEQNSEEFRSQC